MSENAMRKNGRDISPSMTRRGVLGGGLAASAVVVSSPHTVNAAAPGTDQVSVRQEGSYDTVALAKDSVEYACVQHPVLPVDPANPRPGIAANLKRMVTLIDEHAHWAGPADLLSFHEFPIAGYAGWTRKEMLSVAIEIPGKETDVLAAKAREYGLWLTFGCYAQDPDWLDHVLMLGVLMNPKGEIVAKHWKARGGHGLNPAFELITTTVYDVSPRYVEMYGWDEVIPVARTEVGNICITGVQNDPLLYASMALKGCELCIRQASGSNPTDDAVMTSRYNGYFTSIVSNSISPGNRYFADAAGGFGVTQIIGPNGTPLAKAWGPHEEIVRAKIPLAAHRERRTLPDWKMDIYRPVFDAYRARFGPGEYLDGLPETMKEAATRYYPDGRWN